MARLSKQQLAEKVRITCYRKTETMTRKKAINYYQEGIVCCDPGSSECERYTTIVSQLLEGKTEVSDQVY